MNKISCPFCGTIIEEFETIYYGDCHGLWEEPAKGRTEIVVYEPKGISCDKCKPWLELYMRLTADEIEREIKKGGSG